MAQTGKSVFTPPLRTLGFVLMTPLLGASLGSLGSAVLTTDLANPAPGWMTSQDSAPAWPIPEYDVTRTRTAINT